MPIDSKHNSYNANQSKRDVFRAVKGGTDALWAGDKTYLPKYPGESDAEYTSRKSMSTIDGIVSGGVDSLCGAVFYGDIDTSKVNPAIQPLLENIDNEGNSLNVFARRAFEDSFDGFSVILIDQPSVARPVTSLEDKNNAGIRPYWRIYTAANVWNWRYRVNPNTQAKELSLLVLREITSEYKDKYESESVTRYRVYYFNEQNVAQMELWKEVKDGIGENRFVQEGETVAFAFFSAIPAAIIGELKDEPRLLVESRLEVLGYQKESSFNIIEYLSIPTFYTKGWQPVNPGDKLSLGASTHIQLPADANAEAGYIQIDAGGHASLKETIANIKNTIKARLNLLIDDAISSQKTATEASIEDRDKQARLIVWAEQFIDALELALSFTAEAMGLGKDKGGEIELRSRWNDEGNPDEQLKRLDVAQKEKDVLELPIGMVWRRYGLSEDEITEANKENALITVDETIPDDTGTDS